MHELSERRFRMAGVCLATIGIVQAAFYFVVGLDLFEAGMRPLIAFWIALPLPLAFWIASRVVATSGGRAIVLAAMAIALAFSVWAYWEITWGESRRTESLSGLMFIFAPLYQYPFLIVALLVGWLLPPRARAD